MIARRVNDGQTLEHPRSAIVGGVEHQEVAVPPPTPPPRRLTPEEESVDDPDDVADDLDDTLPADLWF